jgi:hypothetical protein
MKTKRVVIALLLLTLLASGTVTPKPAHANTTDDFILAGIVTAGYVGLVFAVTAWVYRNDTPLEPFAAGPPVLSPTGQASQRVHPAPGCAQTSPNLTLLCW